jgi:predicted DNA-binding WGR domain protein
MGIERQVILECVQPSKNHNKYYEINIDSSPDDKRYKVRCRWGRIEHFKDGNPQQQVKFVTHNWNAAMSEVEALTQNKVKKGYKLIKIIEKDEVMLDKKVKAAPTKEFDRTEHVETIVSDWWAGSDNIEERAV